MWIKYKPKPGESHGYLSHEMRLDTQNRIFRCAADWKCVLGNLYGGLSQKLGVYYLTGLMAMLMLAMPVAALYCAYGPVDGPAYDAVAFQTAESAAVAHLIAAVGECFEITEYREFLHAKKLERLEEENEGLLQAYGAIRDRVCDTVSMMTKSRHNKSLLSLQALLAAPYALLAAVINNQKQVPLSIGLACTVFSAVIMHAFYRGLFEVAAVPYYEILLWNQELHMTADNREAMDRGLVHLNLQTHADLKLWCREFEHSSISELVLW